MHYCVKKKNKLCVSIVNRLSMTPSELELQGQGDNSSDDEDYEPSFNLSLR